MGKLTVVIGARRIGKTHLCRQIKRIFKDDVFFIGTDKYDADQVWCDADKCHELLPRNIILLDNFDIRTDNEQLNILSYLRHRCKHLVITVTDQMAILKMLNIISDEQKSIEINFMFI